ncbi:uncharacterized protein LOC118183964 [Stegodyphus dumicola]|uniref:uncharacterized protein LOC118183964 n=1 Tax=Stegodyphus dumicola TaxID=202533 RepID=UPI0015AB71B0|nr:uncharacterized protein LOC118183964 [Stegodyphus dumicola]
MEGVKGLSSLFVLPYFDTVSGFQIDYSSVESHISHIVVEELAFAIQDSMFEIANCYFTFLVFEFELLYGEVTMNFNVHLVLHLSTSVSIWGPLWLYSVFPFESRNGRSVKLVKAQKEF